MGSSTKNQPSDLQSPVPGAEAQNDVPPPASLPSPSPSPSSAPAPSPLSSPASPSSPSPSVAEAPAAEPTPSVGTTDDLFNQLRQLDDSQTQMAGPEDERPLGLVQELKMRAVSGVGQGNLQIQRLVQKMLGNDFSTKIKGEEVLFRKNGSNKWHRIDLPAFSGGAQEVLGDVADVFATTLGNVAGGIYGAGKGALMAGPAAVVPGIGQAVAAGGAIAGASVGSAMGEAAVRQAALAAFDEMSPSPEIANDLLISTGINAATFGLAGLLKSGARKAVTVLEEAVKDIPMRRVQQLASIRQSLEEVVSSIGVRNRTAKETGTLVKAAVDHVEDELAGRVGTVKGLMETKFAGQAVPVDAYAKKIEDILNSVGINKALIQKMDLNKGLKKNVMDGLRASKAFGDPEASEAFVTRLLSDYRRINQANLSSNGKLPGGFEIPEMFDTLKYWQGQAAYKPGISSEATDAMEGMARQLRGALAQDRNLVAQTAFKGTPQEEIISSAMKDYSSKIDAIDGVKKLFNQKKSVELFTDALFEKGNSDRIVDLKSILGESSPEFQAMKAHWMGKIYDKAVDPTTGTVNGKALRDQLKGYGEDVLREILPSRERVALNFVANQAEKIGFMDILGSSAKQTIKDSGQTIVMGTSNPGPMVRMLWNLTRGNAEAAKYLANDGLLQIAQDINDPLKGEMVLRATSMFRKVIDATNVTVKKGRRVLEIADFEDFITDPKAMEKLGMTKEQFLNMANETARVNALPGFGPKPAMTSGSIQLRVGSAVHDKAIQRNQNLSDRKKEIEAQRQSQ